MEKESSQSIILQLVQDSWSIRSRLNASQKNIGGRSNVL